MTLQRPTSWRWEAGSPRWGEEARRLEPDFLPDGQVHAAEDVDDLRVELPPRVPDELAPGGAEVPRRAVGAVRSHGVERVGYGEDPGLERDGLALQALRVARAVVFFVMVEDDVPDLADELDVTDETETEGGVPADDLPFLGRQRTGLLQDGIGDGHLARVVEERPLADAVERARVADADGLGQDVAVTGDRLGVAVGFDVPQVQGGHEVFERRVVSLLELPGFAEMETELFLEPAQIFLGGFLAATGLAF